jgi:hypothetical protein
VPVFPKIGAVALTQADPSAVNKMTTKTVADFERRARGHNRRVSNGDQVSRVAALAMKRGKSVDFPGYWQRHIAD